VPRRSVRLAAMSAGKQRATPPVYKSSRHRPWRSALPGLVKTTTRFNNSASERRLRQSFDGLPPANEFATCLHDAITEQLYRPYTMPVVLLFYSLAAKRSEKGEFSLSEY